LFLNLFFSDFLGVSVFLENYFNLISGVFWKCLNFQVPATPVMEGIVDLNAYISFYLIIILSVVIWVLFSVVINFYYFRFYPRHKFDVISFSGKGVREGRFWEENVYLEGIWTFVPFLILLSIAVPSLALLYSMEEVFVPVVSVKVIANQWYWSYEIVFDPVRKCFYGRPVYKYHNIFKYSFDSYILGDQNYELDDLRLLAVDSPLYLPIRTHIKILVTSNDVIHSWALPSLGVKLDAIPGRLNQALIFIQKYGNYYGQCSEICGSGHGFMPICVSTFDYFFWEMLSMHAFYENLRVLYYHVHLNISDEVKDIMDFFNSVENVEINEVSEIIGSTDSDKE